MYPPYRGPKNKPILTLKTIIFVHMSDTLLDSNGYIFSPWLIIIGIWRLMAGISVKPEKNSPKPIMIKLSGNIAVGPIKKLDNPHRNSPSQIRLIGSIILVRYGIAKAIKICPAIKTLHIMPVTYTESVNSATLNESKGSAKQYAK